MDIEKYMQDVGARARAASSEVAAADTASKNRALLAMRDALASAREELTAANALDMTRGEANGHQSVQQRQAVADPAGDSERGDAVYG